MREGSQERGFDLRVRRTTSTAARRGVHFPSQSGETEELLLHRREFYPVELRDPCERISASTTRLLTGMRTMAPFTGFPFSS